MIRLFVVFVVLIVPINCLGSVKLLYYSGPNVDSVDLRKLDLNKVLLDPSKQVKILCHGWLSSSLDDWYVQITKSYLAKGHQVLAVDWEDDASRDYNHIVLVANDVAQVIANKIIQLVYNSGLKYDKVHIIGHSLGAHIAGFTGKHIFAFSGWKVGRITGLDPAAPQYYNVPPNKRLDADDAAFVDVIHTSLLVGIQKPIGHVDFYPDGGLFQHACLLTLQDILVNPFCSHFITPEYMIESIASNKFVGKAHCSIFDIWDYIKCRQKADAIMGEGCDPTATGVYCLSTNHKSMDLCRYLWRHNPHR